MQKNRSVNWKINSENYSSSTENSIKKNEYSLRDCWESMKNTNTHITGSQKETAERKGQRVYLNK